MHRTLLTTLPILALLFLAHATDAQITSAPAEISTFTYNGVQYTENGSNFMWSDSSGNYLGPGTLDELFLNYTVPGSSLNPFAVVYAFISNAGSETDNLVALVIDQNSGVTYTASTTPSGLTLNAPSSQLNQLTEVNGYTYTPIPNSGTATTTAPLPSASATLPSPQPTDSIWDSSFSANLSKGNESWLTGTVGGKTLHQSIGVWMGYHNHGFSGSNYAIGLGDHLITYVYIDPARKPLQLLLTFYSNGVQRIAYWGSDALNQANLYGSTGNGIVYRAGDLPPAGQWARLDTSAIPLGLAGTNVTDMTFGVDQGNVAWTQTGQYALPAPAISTIQYAGQTYSLSNNALLANGDIQLQYRSGDGGVATVETLADGSTVVKMVVSPSAGGTATYTGGASVGQPGAYFWSSTSTAANQLTQVGNQTYAGTGDALYPTGQIQSSTGDLDVLGNVLNLGSWANDPTQVGLSIAFSDRVSSTSAGVFFTANRPGTAWLWSSVTPDGTGSIPAMRLDGTSRLLLYPPGQTSAGGNAAPAIVLDPGSGGTSQFNGQVRMNAAVRIAPQGDLLMGGFTVEPTPAP